MANLLAHITPEKCGILRLRYVRCGKRNCRCRRGFLHGPYIVLQYRVYRPGKGWVKATKYVRARDLERVRADLFTARQYTKAALCDEYKVLKDTIDQFLNQLEEAFKHV